MGGAPGTRSVLAGVREGGRRGPGRHALGLATAARLEIRVDARPGHLVQQRRHARQRGAPGTEADDRVVHHARELGFQGQHLRAVGHEVRVDARLGVRAADALLLALDSGGVDTRGLAVGG